MKKLLFLFFSVFIFLASQNAEAQPYIGVFGGMSSSKLLGDNPENASYKSLIGLNVGAYLDLKLSKNTWISLQPSYSQEGTKISYKVWGKSEPVDSMRIKLNYFSLPLFLKITANNQRFYALGGVEAGYLIDKYTSSHDVQQDIEVDIAEWNLAVHFGVGYRIPLGLPRLFIELRYSQGLINLTEEAVERNYIPRVKTTGFKILTGIEIPLKRIQN